jgi:hypothetical protein
MLGEAGWHSSLKQVVYKPSEKLDLVRMCKVGYIMEGAGMKNL